MQLAIRQGCCKPVELLLMAVKIDGPYPELAQLVRQITGDVPRQTAANRAKISHDTIARLWQGYRASPSTLERLAEGYKVDPKPLLVAAGHLIVEGANGTVSASQIKYEVDFEGLPTPEGYRDLDDDGREYVAEAVQVAVEAALRKQRKRGGISFGADRYDSTSGKEAERDKDTKSDDGEDGMPLIGV